jgi:hypothetical protein
MRSPTIPPKGAASFEELRPACQVLILHEDFSAYTHAVEVCRRVMERFASELDFNIKCWNFIELADPNCARHAAKSAAAADIILLSVHGAHLSPEIDYWLNSFFAARYRADGVLALLLDSPAPSPSRGEELTERLQQLAARLGLDFISLLPGDDAAVLNLPRPAPTLPRVQV